MFYSGNRPNIAVEMPDCASLGMSFKIGILKELHKRHLITRDELERAIKAVDGQHGTRMY